MPPNRSKTMNPQGRQKSCSECVKAKRRCGLEQPSCSRCSRQHLTCFYPTQPHARAVDSKNAPLETDLGTNVGFDIPDAALALQDTTGPDLSFDFDIQPGSAILSADLLDFDFSSSASSLDPLSEMLYTSTNDGNRTALQRTTNRAALPISSAHLSHFAKSRVDYSIEQFKIVPKMMVEHNSTPWAHPMLYEDGMPRSLQDAHAACALYITKNQVNTDHVTRYISDRATELAASTVPTIPLDLLAHAQALILHQLMLVFGGDIRCYDQAGMLLPHMEDIATTVRSLAMDQIDTTGSLPFYPSNAARLAWRSYIFRESLRRTSILMFHITTMCYLLRGQLKSCAHYLSEGNRITVSAHLWTAPSAFDFAVAWNDKKHYLVKEMDFTDVLDNAKPDELDLFTKMMLVGMQGIDDVKGWFHTRGALI